MHSRHYSFSNYPREIRSGTQRPFTVYTLLPDHYAVHREQADILPSDAATLAMSEAGRMIEVFRGEADESEQVASQAEVCPVYALQPGGTPAVPTGRIFIRFKENIPAQERRREIEQAGYEIAQAIVYAPHAAWLRALSGAIVDALTGIPTLEKIADVENVEPQMLMQRANRQQLDDPCRVS